MSVPGGMFACMGNMIIPTGGLARENHDPASSSDLPGVSGHESTGCRRAHRTEHAGALWPSVPEPRWQWSGSLRATPARPRRYARGDRVRCSGWSDNELVSSQNALIPRGTHRGRRNVGVDSHGIGRRRGSSTRLADSDWPDTLSTDYGIVEFLLSAIGTRTRCGLCGSPSRSSALGRETQDWREPVGCSR